MTYVRPDYHKPGFPVLAYHYALYCDTSFSENEFKRWRDAGGRDGSYRGNLIPYTADERPFPAEVEALALVEVAAGGVQEAHQFPDETTESVRYRPTWSMAERQAVHLLRELTGEPAAAGWRRVRADDVPSVPRMATLNATYPLLSTLAVMFLGGDKSVWNTYSFGWSVSDVLQRLSRGEALTSSDVQPLVAPLADEFSKPPAAW